MKTFIKNNLFPLTLFLLIIIAFIILQPTSVSSLNLNNRQTSWNTFVSQVEGKRMDTKRFWQTREFYSPGYFVYKKEGIAPGKQDQLLKEIGLSSSGLGSQIIVLDYNAPSFRSYESLIPDESVASLQKSINDVATKDNVLAKGENFVIIKTSPDKAMLMFIATLDEMKKTNGFFKYEEDDKELLKGKSWFNISEVSTN
jgi:hypothetical protein